MSFPTVPAYVAHCQGWEERLREHPILDWMMDYEKDFDYGNMRSGPHDTWHTDDFAYTKPSGVSITGGAPAWTALVEVYKNFAGQFHEPKLGIIWETAAGYEMLGWANMYVTFGVPGEKPVKDLQGREYHVVAPAAFHFEFVKDSAGPKGFKMKSERIMGDGIPLMADMSKRGIATVEQLLAMMSA